MRISHKHKFVFLAMPRTASTSIRRTLDPYSDLRSKHISETNNNFPFYHHISAGELKKIFDKRSWEWEKYNHFCLVRNPFDRVVSLYRHYCEKMRGWKDTKGIIKNTKKCLKEYAKGKPSFREYVENIDPRNDKLAMSVKQFTESEEGEKLVEDILKFENLPEVFFNYMKNKVGLKLDIERLPIKNESEVKNTYIEYYDEYTKNMVEEKYRREIREFGYEKMILEDGVSG